MPRFAPRTSRATDSVDFDEEEGRSLTISIQLNELADPKIKKSMESVIRGCIGDRSKEEDWKVWIHSSSGYCQVTVKGPSQTRGRIFFEQDHTLPEKVREWLDLYPF